MTKISMRSWFVDPRERLQPRQEFKFSLIFIQPWPQTGLMVSVKLIDRLLYDLVGALYVPLPLPLGSVSSPAADKGSEVSLRSSASTHLSSILQQNKTLLKLPF